MSEQLATGASIFSFAGTIGALKWFHTRSIKQGETVAAHESRLNGHDKSLADVCDRLEETNANLRVVMDHLMNGEK